jgi:hypothetical protein
MADTTAVAPSTEDPAASHPARPGRLNQALAWVGIAAGGLFVVGTIFLSGYFLSSSQHMHMGMSHAPMAHDQKDCCAGMKHADMKPSATESDMMGPQSGR